MRVGVDARRDGACRTSSDRTTVGSPAELPCPHTRIFRTPICAARETPRPGRVVNRHAGGGHSRPRHRRWDRRGVAAVGRFWRSRRDAPAGRPRRQSRPSAQAHRAPHTAQGQPGQAGGCPHGAPAQAVGAQAVRTRAVRTHAVRTDAVRTHATRTQARPCSAVPTGCRRLRARTWSRGRSDRHRRRPLASPLAVAPRSGWPSPRTRTTARRYAVGPC